MRHAEALVMHHDAITAVSFGGDVCIAVKLPRWRSVAGAALLGLAPIVIGRLSSRDPPEA